MLGTCSAQSLHGPLAQILISPCRQMSSICFCLGSWSIDTQQTGCKQSFLSFYVLFFCSSFHPLPLSYPLSSPLTFLFISTARELQGLSLWLRAGRCRQPLGTPWAVFSRSFHTRQGSLAVLEETRAGKQANHIACIDKWFSTDILWSVCSSVPEDFVTILYRCYW